MYKEKNLTYSLIQKVSVCILLTDLLSYSSYFYFFLSLSCAQRVVNNTWLCTIVIIYYNGNYNNNNNSHLVKFLVWKIYTLTK